MHRIRLLACIIMSSPEHIDILVRAYKAAWEFYFRPERDTPVLECLARPALAQFLANKRKEGVTDAPSLAAAGLEFLFSLEVLPEDIVDEPADEPDFAWNVLHLENAAARFVPVTRARMKGRGPIRHRLRRKRNETSATAAGPSHQSALVGGRSI